MDLELLACFHVANRFLRIGQFDYVEEVVNRGGLKLYVQEIRRTDLYSFLTDFLTPQEQDSFFVKIMMNRTFGERKIN